LDRRNEEAMIQREEVYSPGAEQKKKKKKTRRREGEGKRSVKSALSVWG